MLTVVDLIEKLKMTHFVENRLASIAVSNEAPKTDLCTQSLTDRYEAWVPHASDPSIPETTQNAAVEEGDERMPEVQIRTYW